MTRIKLLMKEAIQYGRELILRGVSSSVVPRIVRGRLLTLIGHEIDPTAIISSTCFVGAAKGLTVRARTFVNRECFFDLSSSVTIGKECAIGYRVTFVTSGHMVGTTDRRAGQNIAEGIDVHDGAWIGAAAMIMPGVTIGKGAVIAAGSVVVSDCASNHLYMGVPARSVRKLDGSD